MGELGGLRAESGESSDDLGCVGWRYAGDRSGAGVGRSRVCRGARDRSGAAALAPASTIMVWWCPGGGGGTCEGGGNNGGTHLESIKVVLVLRVLVVVGRFVLVKRVNAVVTGVVLIVYANESCCCL